MPCVRSSVSHCQLKYSARANRGRRREYSTALTQSPYITNFTAVDLCGCCICHCGRQRCKNIRRI